MEVGSNLILTEREITKYFKSSVQDIQDMLSLPNPEYQNIMRFGKGKFYKNVPSHICYLRTEGIRIPRYVLPRYFFGELGSDLTYESHVNVGRSLESDHTISLRGYQKDFFKANSSKIDSSTGLLLEAPCGHGKCHGKGTRILMYDGTVKNVEDIKVGDLLMGDDSTPRRVLSLARGREEMFEVIQKKGITYTVNKSHILSLRYRPWSGRSKKATSYERDHYDQVFDLPLTEYLDYAPSKKSGYYGYCVPVDYPERNLKFDPYLLGCWLGDGTSKELSFTCSKNDRTLVHYYAEVSAFYNLQLNRIKQINSDGPRNNSNLYRLKSSVRVKGHWKNTLWDLFKEYGLKDNKHIPDDFLVNSRENRLKLLAGILDTDGHLRQGIFDLVQKRKNLILQIRSLCWSLGFRARLTEKILGGQSYWRLSISGNIHEIPTKLPRKKAPVRTINKDPFVNGISVKSIGEGDYYGFMIDGNHRYCLEDGTVTHNTVMGIWLAYLRYVQTLVLVPTYYLARQWKERIEQVSTASVYIVTSKDSAIPIDSDFTIAVMDLFSVRTLPESFVKNVGHVILDEAHRIGAETYMPILDQIPARYRTALTATFRRSDGVHKILKYHFGEHIQMENRFPKPRVFSMPTGVTVEMCLSKNKKYQHFIEFLDSNDLDYTETQKTIAFPKDVPYEEIAARQLKVGSLTKTAYTEICSCLRRGKELSYSVVESYLNESSSRRKRVISLIQRCLDAGRTVLFLSKRKDILHVLYKHFAKYRPMLIVSGTDDLSAEESKYLQEACPLILGVTQLAKEGLDVDRLDTLIVYLPLKDLEQALGRISRLHPKKKEPIAFYMLDNCALTWATFMNAKRMMKKYADYVDSRTLQTINTIL